ncbi:MAG: type VI secretion system-associated protein TagF [Marinovum sp.]|nr:type VI secretion system-associated protein TagF [Marinovum sp.]
MAEGFGAFGKMPSLGDFFRMNLSAGFVQAWDMWLQSGMVTAKTALGEEWSDAYLSAPIWRFTLPAGVAGSHSISGVMMPSVDRVGRLYPLTLAAAHHSGQTALRHLANRLVFEALEETALAALEDGATKENLGYALQDHRWIIPEPAPVMGHTYAGPMPPAQILAADVLAAQHGDACIWSASMEGDNRLLVTPGLPQGNDVIALFDTAAPVWSANGLGPV